MSPFEGSAGRTERWEHFAYAEEAGVATVTFDRPERLNALTFEVYADLRDLLAELPRRDGVRVLVLTGRGRGFCSGGDVHDIIGALQAMGPRELLEFTRMTGAVVQGLRELPLPVVAAVNGVAAGAGAVIALAADLRVLARSASLAFLFTKVGLAGADMGCAYLLPRLVGLGRATELLLLGDRVDADRAASSRPGQPGGRRRPADRRRPASWPGGWPTARPWPMPPPRSCSPASSTCPWPGRWSWRPSPRPCCSPPRTTASSTPPSPRAAPPPGGAADGGAPGAVGGGRSAASRPRTGW